MAEENPRASCRWLRGEVLRERILSPGSLTRQAIARGENGYERNFHVLAGIEMRAVLHGVDQKFP